MWVSLASWRNQSLFCVSRHWAVSLKKDDKSIWIIPLSTKSSSQLILSSWVWLVQSYYSLCSSKQTLENDFRMESALEDKALPAEGDPAALQGLRQTVIPLAFPTGLQIKLNKWRSHAGQRLWGHMTCHAAFQLHPSYCRCSWGIQQSGDRWRCINAVIPCMLHALLPIVSFQTVHFIYIHCTWSAVCMVNVWWNYTNELHY